MNRYEINWAASSDHDCPNVRKGVRLLQRLMEAVDNQSDGWAYWHAPSKAAAKLIELLQGAGDLHRGTHGTISDADFKKAVGNIRRMVTLQQKKQKQYGNKFEFDVDAALADDPPVPEYVDVTQELLNTLKECVTEEDSYAFGNGVDGLLRRIRYINEIARAAIQAVKTEELTQ